jgi:hypothetical protein
LEAERAFITSSKQHMGAAATEQVLARETYWAIEFLIMTNGASFVRGCLNVL